MLNLLACLVQALWRVTDSHRSVFRVWTRCYFLKPLLICTRDICGEAEQTLICCYLSGSQPSRGECGSVCTALQASLLGTGLVFAASWRTLPRRAVNPPQGSNFKKAHTEVCICQGAMVTWECLDWFYDSVHRLRWGIKAQTQLSDSFLSLRKCTVFCENK